MDAIDQALASLDEETARRAEPAIGRLLGPPDERAPLDSLCLLDVEDFLWRSLPTKFWTDDHDHHEIAWALGDLLEALAQDKYAAVCRHRRTHEILAAWHQDEEHGAELAASAVVASGVLPPDTPLLRFGEVMGRRELDVFRALSVALEAAIDDGRLDPSASGFGREQEGFTETYLRSGPLAVVRRERAESWAMGLRGDVEWLRELLPVLEERSGMPANVELSLAPARALLERAVDGVTLTGSGYLPPALVVELNDRFRWYDFMGKPPSREKDVSELVEIREHLGKVRLVRSRKGLLRATAKGRSCLEDAEAFWCAVTTTTRWDDFTQEVVAVSAALLLSGRELSRHGMAHEVASLIQHRWLGTGDFGQAVEWAYLDWYRLGLAFGWWEARRGKWLDTLSPRGEGAAARAFWAIAAQPAAL